MSSRRSRLSLPLPFFLSFPLGNLLLPLSLPLPFLSAPWHLLLHSIPRHKINLPNHPQKQPKIRVSSPQAALDTPNPAPPLAISLSSTWHSAPTQTPTIEAVPIPPQERTGHTWSPRGLRPRRTLERGDTLQLNPPENNTLRPKYSPSEVILRPLTRLTALL
jgi:hypothetical protein